VSEEFLEQLHRNCVPLRPSYRQKTSLDTHAALGWLLPDLSYLPEYCEIAISQASVEIKPKCGTLPRIDCLEAENSIKSKKSRFQMMQFLKLVEGRVVSISKYNPLDLFCGNIERMASALRALFAKPQNNFRLWIDRAECISDATELKSQSILNFLSSAFESSDETSDLSKILATILTDCRVLDEIQRLQELDRFDIESVALIDRHLTNPGTFSVSDVRQQAPCSCLPPASLASFQFFDVFLTCHSSGA
jgi:inositol-pentakisphosphate 2-kinase